MSSAKGSFDRFDNELTQNAANIIMLDRTLLEYGPETDGIRESLKSVYARRIDRLFSGKTTTSSIREISEEENIDARIYSLVPGDQMQQGLKARAVKLNGDINSARALIHAQRYDSIPTSLLLVLCAWLSLIFLTFGLFAPRNAVVVGMLLMCSMAASATVFLILEMHLPFDGVITLSSAPMHDALQYLGR